MGVHRDRIAVRFAYEWHDDAGQWYRAYGNENWQFDADGFMAERHASINDVAIDEADGKFHWDRSAPAAGSSGPERPGPVSARRSGSAGRHALLAYVP